MSYLRRFGGSTVLLWQTERRPVSSLAISPLPTGILFPHFSCITIVTAHTSSLRPSSKAGSFLAPVGSLSKGRLSALGGRPRWDSHGGVTSSSILRSTSSLDSTSVYSMTPLTLTAILKLGIWNYQTLVECGTLINTKLFFTRTGCTLWRITISHLF